MYRSQLKGILKLSPDIEFPDFGTNETRQSVVFIIPGQIYGNLFALKKLLIFRINYSINFSRINRN